MPIHIYLGTKCTRQFGKGAEVVKQTVEFSINSSSFGVTFPSLDICSDLMPIQYIE